MLPAVTFFVLHASYPGWTAGASFSARYLVPMVPILVLGVALANPRGILFRLSLVYSCFFGMLGGLLPAMVYDRNPWQIVSRLLREVVEVLS
jgi:hypothetical protein